MYGRETPTGLPGLSCRISFPVRSGRCMHCSLAPEDCRRRMILSPTLFESEHLFFRIHPSGVRPAGQLAAGKSSSTAARWPIKTSLPPGGWQSVFEQTRIASFPSEQPALAGGGETTSKRFSLVSPALPGLKSGARREVRGSRNAKSRRPRICSKTIWPGSSWADT